MAFSNFFGHTIIMKHSYILGWLALVAGEQLKERLHGMLLYAPALNYVYPYYQKHLSRLPADVQHRSDFSIKFCDSLCDSDS